MVKISQEDFEATKFLAGVVGAVNPYLKSLAMVAQEERELMAYIQCVKIINENLDLIENFEENQLKDLLDKFVTPLLQTIGEAKFKMGEISHLACKIGQAPKAYKGGFPSV